uniref:trans-L-3-hydroxyproline dehydratase n=2 Tax=Ciona intestinalis TaxID=7719 RepID=H2XL36_CIOIN
MCDVITTVDMHSGGSPMRIITSGIPEIVGKTYKERFEYVTTKLDYVREFLCYEPRGYRYMTCILPVLPDDEADLGVIFIAATLYLPMCGEALTCFARYAVDKNLVNMTTPETKIDIQCPCGIVTCHVDCTNGKAGKVRLESVPCYLHSSDIQLVLDNDVNVTVDLLYGGAYYVIVSCYELQKKLSMENFRVLEALSYDVTVKMRKYVKEKYQEDNRPFICGTIVRSHVRNSNSSEHFVNVGEMLINRGYCGSATMSRATLDYFQGHLNIGESRVYNSIVTNEGTTATVLRTANYGNKKAVIIGIQGIGFYTGKHEFTFEHSDNLKNGFLVK